MISIRNMQASLHHKRLFINLFAINGWKVPLISGLTILLSAFVATAAYADVVLLEDNFDRENNGQGKLNYIGFSKWIVTKGTVDLTGNGFWDLYPGKGLYVDLDGSTEEGGKIESRTEFSLLPGTYKLQFDIGNNNYSERRKNTVTVMLGRLSEKIVYGKSFSLIGSPPYQTISETITITEPLRGRLMFEQSGNDNEGIIIDNVKLIYLSD